jgi:hypothetical protein
VNVPLVTLIVTVSVTILALVVLALFVRRRILVIAGDLDQLRTRVLPDLERLQRDGEIAARELDRIAETASSIGRRADHEADVGLAGPRAETADTGRRPGRDGHDG